MIACMGGWCLKREKCAHYLTRQGRKTAVERLCLHGRDGFPGVVGAAESEIEFVEMPSRDVAEVSCTAELR